VNLLGATPLLVTGFALFAANASIILLALGFGYARHRADEDKEGLLSMVRLQRSYDNCQTGAGASGATFCFTDEWPAIILSRVLLTASRFSPERVSSCQWWCGVAVWCDAWCDELVWCVVPVGTCNA